MRDTFVFYKSWRTSLNRLPDGESFKKVFNAICDAIFEEKKIKESDFTDKELIVLDLTIPLVLAAKANYENGLKGGRPRKINYEKAMELKDQGLNNSQIADIFGVSKRAIEIFFQERKNEKTPKKRNDNDNVNVNVNDNVNDNDNVNENEKENVNNNNNNSIPSLSDISQFCKANSLIVKPEEFFGYYNERGWELVYDWKNLLKKWNKNQLERQKVKDSSDPYAGLR